MGILTRVLIPSHLLKKEKRKKEKRKDCDMLISHSLQTSKLIIYINVCGSVFSFLVIAMLYRLSGYSNIYFSFFNKYIIDIFLRNYPSIRHKRWENGGKKRKKKGKLRCQIKFLSHNFHEASQLSTPFRKWMPSVQFLHVSKSWGGKKKQKERGRCNQNRTSLSS